jgi:hypothetical protein
MSNYKKLTAAALATFAIAISLGSGPAAAACDGSWQRDRGAWGAVLYKQCYYLPTVSNGRVTGLELKQNFQWSRGTGRYR